MSSNQERTTTAKSGFSEEELGRILTAALDRSTGDDPPPAPEPAAQILQRLRRRRRARRRQLLQVLTRYGAVVAVVVLLFSSTYAVVARYRLGQGAPAHPAATRTSSAPADRGTAGQPRMLALPGRTAWSPARVGLGRLATTVAASHDVPSVGRYTYTRTRLWARDTTAASPETAVTVRDERRWWAADRSGRHNSATIRGWMPGQDPGTPAGPDDGDVRYRPGQMPVVAPDLADNVFQVSSQLAEHQSPADGPQATLRAVREVYRYHDPTPAQRAALLQALADTDGLWLAGTVDGGAGRRGLAVVVDSDAATVRDIAVIDPATGRMLAYDTVWLRAPTAVDLASPALADSLLFITANHTTTTR